MNIKNRTAKIMLVAVIILSLAISTFYVCIKQGYHEDELLTYNLANSTSSLSVDGGWNSSKDFNDYLSVSSTDRFDYVRAYQNQITDASHPPFYYFLVHTICSFFPETFSRFFAYAINVLANIGILILIFAIIKRITKNNLYAVLCVIGYGLSIACITTTIYLRMYCLLTFFALAFLYAVLRIFDGKTKFIDYLLLSVIVFFGTLTQYYFIVFEGLTGIVYLIYSIKNKNIKGFIKLFCAVAVASILAFCCYPFIISNLFGGNRGLGSLDISIDTITIVTYVFYKLMTYVMVLSKLLFINQPIILLLFTAVVATTYIYIRFVKKQKLSQKAVLSFIPSIIFCIAISLLSPFNADRYIMASIPMISAVFVLGFIKLVSLLNIKKPQFVIIPLLSAFLVCSLIFVTPNYIYGKSNLYDKQTNNCLFVGTEVTEWNKCIDKLSQYDQTMIVKTSELDSKLSKELEDFATKRGIITNGKITEFADAYINNGSKKTMTSSLEKVKDDKKLNSLDKVTVYISRLADNEKVIKYLKDNTKFKNYKLIYKDYDFDEFYNWYDYFIQTESYCNVYVFY